MEIVKILGVDPGLRFTGYGLVNYDTEKNEIWASNCGVLKTPQAVKGLDAIIWMMDAISEMSEKECFENCDNVVVEIPAAIYSNKFSSGSLLPVAVVAGSALKTFEDRKIIPVYPTVWNSGKRKDKTRVLTEDILGVYDEWDYNYKPKAKPQFEHIIDAVSMALWYMRLNYIED